VPNSLSNRRRKEIGKLTRKKRRRERGEMLVEGVRAVTSALEAGAPLVDLVVTEEAQQDERVQAVLQRADVPIHVAGAGEIEQLTDTRAPQGLLAVAQIEHASEEQLAERSTILALDAVQDPGNAGTALRTAAWFGAEAIVAGRGTVGLAHPKLVRAAVGSLWDVKRAETNDLPGLLRRLAERGFARYGADLSGTPVRRWQPRRPSVLVLGSEAHGLSAEVQAGLSERVVIAGASERTGAESLNVAVAGGVLMYEWLAGNG
jgi:TrmH family RNA methyltransferase